MTIIPIWPGSSSFRPGDTPFGFYDNDPQFLADIDSIADWCARRLGYPIVDIELQASNFYACAEEAIAEYSNQVNQFNIQQNLLSLIGQPTNVNLTQRVVTPVLGPIIDIAAEYGADSFTSAGFPYHTASIDIFPGQQVYSLNKLVRDVLAPTGSIEIKRVHHYAPPASMRFYDPYLGNQAMLDTFGFGAYSTGVSFMLMPMYADLLRVQAIEFNDQMRKSGYSFEIFNNDLRIFPVPSKGFKLWLDYIIREEKNNPLKNAYNSGSVSDMSNAPYNLIPYRNINSVGKQWIYKYALILATQTLGYIRGKYTTIPIPNSETTLGDLLASAEAERARLIEELRLMLDSMTRPKLLESKAAEAENINKTLNTIPAFIYIG
jgi:hypothetical protein